MGLGSVLGAAVGALTDNEELGDFIGGVAEAAGDCLKAGSESSAQAANVPALARLSDTKAHSNGKSAFRRIENKEDDNITLDSIPKYTTSKPKMLNFGDALASGLPESWSIVPPDSGVISKRKPQ